MCVGLCSGHIGLFSYFYFGLRRACEKNKIVFFPFRGWGTHIVTIESEVCLTYFDTASKKMPAAQRIMTVPSVAKIVTRTWTWRMILYTPTLSLSLFLFLALPLSFWRTRSLSFFSFFLCHLLCVSLSHTHTQIYITRFWMGGWVWRVMSRGVGCEYLDISCLKALFL